LAYNQPLWFSEDLPKTRAALTKLGATASARQAKAPTAREKLYIDAVEKLFGDGPKASRDRAYADRMAEWSRRFPDDDEAAAVDLAKRKGLSAAQYDFHSMSWLQYEYLQQGRFTKAREAMAEVQRAMGSEGSGGSGGSKGSRGSNPSNAPNPPNHQNHVES